MSLLQNVYRVRSTIASSARRKKRNAPFPCIRRISSRKKVVLRKQSCKKRAQILTTYLQQNHCVCRERPARDIFLTFFLFFSLSLSLPTASSLASAEKRALPRGFVTRRAAERLQAFEECICTVRQSCGGEEGKGESKGWKRSGAVRRGYRADIAASMASDVSAVSLFDRDILKFYIYMYTYAHTQTSHGVSYNTVRPCLSLRGLRKAQF